jgi:hypothetical protein
VPGRQRDAWGCSKNLPVRLFRDLQGRGFIRPNVTGHFRVKGGPATSWILTIGVDGLEANPDFSVGAGNAQGFNDTVAQINADLVTFMTSNSEKIARLARGS